MGKLTTMPVVIKIGKEANAKKVQDLVAHYEELQNVKTHWGFNGDLYRINALFNQIFNDEENEEAK